MLRLRVQRLRPRTQTKTHYRGSEQFELVLLLTSLEKGQLYVASEIAAMAVDRKQEPARYKRVKDSLYQRANRYGIVETNQNVDKFGRQQHPAKWDADHWAASLNDRDWMRAYHFYEALYERDQSNRHLGRNLHYYFDDDIGLIETEADTTQQVKALLKLGPWQRYGFWEHHTVVTMLIDPQQIQRQVPSLPAPAMAGSAQADDQPDTPAAQPSWPVRTMLFAMVGVAVFVWLLARPSEKARELERLIALQQSSEPAVIQQLSALLQDEDSTLDPDWVVQAILDKIGTYPSDTNLALLRQLFRNRVTYRPEIVARIADMNMVIDFNPLFPRTPSRPVFIAAIDENPVILYEEGYLRPGDWMNVDGFTGYVAKISTATVELKADEDKFIVPIQKPTVFGMEIIAPENTIFFEGTANLALVLDTLKDIEGLDFIDPSIQGHIGGTFYANSHQQLLEIIANQSGIVIDQASVFAKDMPCFEMIFGMPENWWFSWSAAKARDVFSKQAGVSIDMHEFQAFHTLYDWTRVQWVDFLDFYDLSCVYEPHSNLIYLSSEGGQGE